MESKKYRSRSARGVTWAIAATACLALPLTAAASVAGSLEPAAIIVQELPGAGNGPEIAVAKLGGSVERQIRLINGFTAKVPASAVARLAATPGVRAVTPDSPGTLTKSIDGWDHESDGGSLTSIANSLGARGYWRRGITGRGVDVAVIDSGVSPVQGLDAPDKLVHGPDLSFESQDDATRYIDSFGHGTHMAGIIAARDSGAKRIGRSRNASKYIGIAPDARIVSMKVADRNGAVDVSQVIAAIDWVVQHRNTDGLNIRVLNLSFGTDGTQDYRVDPLAFAVEAAWQHGIVVVASAGNSGFGSSKLNNPAYDPYVIAVGAADTKGDDEPDNDDVPSWSSAGDGTRNPDVVAPGKSIVSLRVGRSKIDDDTPAGRVGGSRFFRGSGTSQAAAVVSGAAALIVQQRPDITPDQVKALLMRSANHVPKAERSEQGAGLIDLHEARLAATPDAVQTWERSTGAGSIDAARGSQRLVSEGVPLKGEMDIFGKPWDGREWAGSMWNGRSWQGGEWNGSVWSGSMWNASGWNASSWAASQWNASAWNGSAWTGSHWNGSHWNASGWNASGWNASGWNGSAWASAGWGT